MLSSALIRRPPFEAETEKGFRDAMVLETFDQLVRGLPEKAASTSSPEEKR